MSDNHNLDVDPKYLKNSENLWNNFIKIGKISTVIVIAILLLMAVTLV